MSAKVQDWHREVAREWWRKVRFCQDCSGTGTRTTAVVGADGMPEPAPEQCPCGELVDDLAQFAADVGARQRDSIERLADMVRHLCTVRPEGRLSVTAEAVGLLQELGLPSILRDAPAPEGGEHGG